MKSLYFLFISLILICDLKSQTSSVVIHNNWNSASKINSGTTNAMADALVGDVSLVNGNTKKTNSVPMMRLKLNGVTNAWNETVIYYQNGATNSFDPLYDAYDTYNPNTAPHITQLQNSIATVINGITPVVNTFSIAIKVTTPTTANFTITATDFEFLPFGTCVTLIDLNTGSSTNLLSSSYAFNLSNATTTPRFVLNITHFNLPILSNLIQPTCQSPNFGKYSAIGTSNAPWNYTWKDATGTVIKTTLNSSNNDSLDNLMHGNYSLEITSANNQCYSKQENFSVDEIIIPTITILSVDTATINVMQNYTFSNLSENCINYKWIFGDGVGNSTEFEPNYYFASTGLFQTKLIGTSETGCKDSAFKYIHVLDLTTNISPTLKQSVTLATLGNNNFVIKLSEYLFNELEIEVNDLEGKSLLKMTKDNLKANDEITLDLDCFKNGMYLLNLKSKKGLITNFKISIK